MPEIPGKAISSTFLMIQKRGSCVLKWRSCTLVVLVCKFVMSRENVVFFGGGTSSSHAVREEPD